MLKETLAEPDLVSIDGILEQFGGQRMAASPDALGCPPVETTAVSLLSSAKH